MNSAWREGRLEMYSLSKTLQKAGLPIGMVILVNVLLQVAAQQGIKLDENVVWTVVTCGYGAILGLINWIKNHGKKPEPAK